MRGSELSPKTEDEGSVSDLKEQKGELGDELLQVGSQRLPAHLTADPGPNPRSEDGDSLSDRVSESPEHRAVLGALQLRRQRLQEVRELWAVHRGAAVMKRLAQWQDPAVLVDILNAMVTVREQGVTVDGAEGRPSHNWGCQERRMLSAETSRRWLSLGLSGCAELLPLLKDLLKAPYAG